MEPKPLLRSLLRQASVLYDDVARKYIARYIKQRFQVNRTAESWRRTKLLKEGRRGLSMLIRANAGDPKPLTRVLEMSYGRSGRRKHELLKPIINKPPEIEPEPLIPGEPRSTPPVVSPALRALLVSQHGKNITTSIKPKIPETNIWGRPFPICRKVNMLHRHHSDLLSKVLPPLSAYEMERLDKFARGLESPKPPKRKLLTQLPMPKNTNVHTMTLRFKRRIWKRILAQSSSLDFNDEKKVWSAKYSPYTEVPQISTGELADFEGLVEEKGGAQRQERGKSSRNRKYGGD